MCSFSLLFHVRFTLHQAWKEILSQLCLSKLTDSRNRFHIYGSHFFAIPFLKKSQVNTSYDLFQLFRSLNERTVKLTFSRCSRACLALRNKHFLRGKAVHYQKTKTIFTGTMTSTVSSYSKLAFSCTHCIGSLSAARC